MTREAAIVAAYRDGVKIEAICAEFGCSDVTIYRYARRAGLPHRGRGQHRDARRTAAIVQAYVAGSSAYDIAHRMNITAMAVYRALDSVGCARRSTGSKSRRIMTAADLGLPA